MKAMVLKAIGNIDSSPLELRDVQIPELRSSEILVEVECCGICRTDLHVTEGELPQHREHIIPGHQVVGRVCKTGQDTSRFHLGDRVGIAWLRFTCGTCRYCKSGRIFVPTRNSPDMTSTVATRNMR
jgi:alcohol dehydrogenase, propanol-preferring